MMEPTDNAIHAGCLGNVNATWTFHGVAGHSARPWFADNAITRAAAGVTALAAHEPEPHAVRRARVRRGRVGDEDRGRHRQQRRSPTEATAHVNYRYAPGRTPEEAEARLAELCGGHGELRIDANAPSGAGRARPARRRADRRRRPRGRAQAGLDAGGGVRAAPGSPAINFGPGDPPQAHTRATSRSRSRALVRGATGCWRRFAARMKPSPDRSAGMRTYPFVRLTEAKRELAGRGRRRRRLRHRASRARRRRRSSARRSPRALEPQSTYPLAEGLPELRAAIAAWIERRFGAGARSRHRGPPHARLQGGDLPPRAGRRRRPRRGHHARLPGAPSAARRSPGKQVLELPLPAERGFLPDLDAVDAATWARVGDPVAQLPEQPDRRDRAARALRARRGDRARARRRASPPTRPTRRSTSAPSRRPRRSRSPTAATSIALNTLSKRSSMPGYRSRLRGRRPRA